MIYPAMHTFYGGIQGHLDRVQGMLFDMKNRTKARFKGAMRFIKNNEDTLKKDSLARKLLSKNDKEFWKEIRVMNSSNMPLPNVIDGVTGSGNIVDMWKCHYNDLFNCLRNNKDVKQLTRRFFLLLMI